MASSTGEDSVLVVLSYLYPALVFLYFLSTSLIATCTLQAAKRAKCVQEERPSRRIVTLILGVFLFTHLAQIIIVGTQAAVHKVPPEEHIVIHHLSCILVFGILLIRLVESDYVVWYPFRGAWFISFPFELLMTALAAVKVSQVRLGGCGITYFALTATRCASLVVLVVWTCLGFWVGITPPGSDQERASLLPKTTGDDSTAPKNTTSPGYGATQRDDDEESEGSPEYSWERRDREARESMEKRLEEVGNWFEYTKGFMILFPYVWPVGNNRLQLRAAAVVLCLFTSNALHLLIPRQTGIIMDTLSGSGSNSPWTAVIVFALLRLAASESGIELVRQWLWVPVKYYSQDALTRASYSHMMHLSADFHDSKSSSDMLMAIQGGSAVSNAVESILLQAVPMLVDMCIAVVYLSITFGPYEGLITVATGSIFIVFATRLVAESKSASRKRINAMYQEYYIRHSGLIGWQTVSSFNQIGYEDNRHANAVTNRWLKEQQYVMSWYVSIAFQTIVLTCGLMASAFLAVYRINNGQATSGQFAMLLMYWAQLTSPLQFFARLGKNMSDDFIDAERLLDVMKTKPSVENRKGARPLKFVSGEVEFDNVCFSYDKKKEIISEVNLQIPAGMTVAFVGATGAGKSTLLKLLDRFYDVTSGSVKIDGQDIREVDLFSLRDRIGIVPQNPILFDDSIMNNVRYGRITASDEEVFEACRAASIHDKILGFTNGYETRVGERGVKLSGGELQRVAIARAILKQPDIVLLDEATSAVDTDTEQQIQRSFKRLCQGRTTFIVAHRLSTIMNADRIVVVEHGKIIEQGSHSELIVANGRYADLWSKQIFIKPQDDIDAVKALDDLKTLANDSCSETTSSEERDAQVDKTGSESRSTEATDAEGDASTPKQHQKEGSRLNPVAPEFTPQALKAPTANPEASSTKQKLDDDVAEVAHNHAVSASTKALEKQHERGSYDAHARSSGDTEQSSLFKGRNHHVPGPKVLDCHSSLRGSETDVASDVVSDTDQVLFKHPRYSRRVQSKSEPSHSSQDSDVAEFPTSTNHTALDAGLSVQRRVSAPTSQGTTGLSLIPKPNSRLSTVLKQMPTIHDGPGEDRHSGPCSPVRKAGTVNMVDIVTVMANEKMNKNNTAIPATGNENEPPSKMVGNPIATSSRGNRGVRRQRGGSLRGRRGRLVRATPSSSRANQDP
ncbi:Heavy metal tolerance protein [Cladobotryum mycophilum]|uniref:Heavy metal tolerance protein n=1 Tax=Cladobotryum mycophilum TaxID=491253 RepID=A0ABR0SWZ7_9HYPO